ncbi:MAG: diguanylate cyclase [Pseudomonadota bacterium]
MNHPAAHAPPPSPGPPDDFTWFSNPLDWRPIDRFILLGALLLISPALFGFALLAAMAFAPDYLATTIARLLLAMYALQGLMLAGYIGAALRRRRHDDDWPAFENFIIVSFVIIVLVSSFATGTHLTEGLLMVFLGINIASALANVTKVQVAYVYICIAMLVLAILDFSGLSPSAPLFVKAPLKPNGSPVLGWLALQATLGAILLAIGYISMAAIRRWVERENLYREMSAVDSLTRLANRRSFMERGQSEFMRAQRISSGSLACIMVDLDHFKRINDSFGHHAGDQVLVAASRILIESARQYDEVGRYGGEEFALLLPGVTLAEAVLVAERIRETLAASPVETAGVRIPLTASLGVACYPAPGISTLDELLKAADAALYLAKAAGRNRVCKAPCGLAEADMPDQPLAQA